MCVIFGIYEDLIDSILGLFKNFKQNIKFLFPLIIGGCVGLFLFSNLLEYLFTYFEMPTKFAFIGFILGSLPLLFKKANSQTNIFKLRYFIFLFATFSIGIIFAFIENIIPIETSNYITSPLFLVISGFCMSIGIVFPGVSSTVILMSLGSYSTYLNAISSLNFYILIPMAVGLIIGSLIFMKIIKYLLFKYFTQTYYCIIGFVLGSIIILVPNFEFNFIGALSILLFAISFFGANYLEKLSY